MINLLNDERKLIYKTTTNKNKLIKFSFLIFLEILLLIEKIKSENTSFFFISKQKINKITPIYIIMKIKIKTIIRKKKSKIIKKIIIRKIMILKMVIKLKRKKKR